MGFLVAFVVFFLRPVSIALVAIRRPLYSIRAIPQNWTRVVLATDIHHPPELFPESETTPAHLMGGFKFLRISEVPQGVREMIDGGPQERFVLAPIFIIHAGIICLFGLAYRYSLKATAIVYLPIIWVLHDSLVETTTLKQKLEDIRESQFERLKRWYSAFVIVFLLFVPAVLYFLLHGWWEQLGSWAQHAHPAIVVLLSAFLFASPSGLHIEGWHVARGFNAMLTLVLFVAADSKLRKIQRGILDMTDTTVAWLNLWLLIRGLLTIYVIGCTLYIVIAAVSWKDLFPIHIRWFPWS